PGSAGGGGGFGGGAHNPHPRLCREPLGIRRAGRGAHGTDPEARGLASGARGLHRRHRCGGDAALGRRHDGPHDARVLLAAPRLLPVHRVPQAQARRARLGRHARVLRQAQLARRLTGHGDRAAPHDLRAGGRLRHAAALLLRLRGQSQGLAALARSAGPRGHAEVQGHGPEVKPARIALALLPVLAGLAAPAAAAPDGTLTWGLHVTLATKWVDPSDTAAFINPFMVRSACRDALVRPMPGGDNTPSLAESWSVSKDGLTYEFVLRKGVKFHNGDPVTAEDVKFSFDRYKGAAAKLLKERVREVQI